MLFVCFFPSRVAFPLFLLCVKHTRFDPRASLWSKTRDFHLRIGISIGNRRGPTNRSTRAKNRRQLTRQVTCHQDI